MDKKENSTVKLPFFGIGRVIKYLKPHIITICILVILRIVWASIDLLLPHFQRYAINNFIAKNTTNGIIVFSVIYLGCLILQAVLNYVLTSFGCKVEFSIGRTLKQESFNKLQNLSFSYFNTNSVGYIHARVMSDTSNIGGMLLSLLGESVSNIIYLVGAMVTMLAINLKLGLILCMIVPFAFLAVILIQKKLVVIHREIREKNSRITGNFNEGITGAQTVKVLGIEDKICSEFREETKAIKKVSVKSTHYNALLNSVLTLFSFTALAIVLWYGGKITIEGLMEIGTLSVFMSYALNILGPVQWIIQIFTNLVATQVNIERFTALMQTGSDVADSDEVISIYGDTFYPKKENWEELIGDVEFKNVSFKYPDGEEYILKDFNLKIPHGTNVAIVGETGAGKSTLINLVCRFYEPTSGQVLIDGKDARERSQLWLHSHIGYVLQTPHLFSGSIRDNLLYGNPGASEEEIISALKTVCADSIIEKMQDGLDSEVGEGGNMLSTGEKQLISFARAILANPKILILDEATSSIDTETEHMIQTAIHSVIEGRTSFVIAHRLSTIKNADIILAVKDGKIIESGTHKELMKEKGYYYSLYTSQYEKEVIDSLT